MLYNAYNQYFIDILTLFDLRIKCFLCLCLWVLCTRRVAEFGDKSHLGAYSQVGFSTEVCKKQSFKSTQRVYLCFCSKINASLLLKIKQKGRQRADPLIKSCKITLINLNDLICR